MRGSNSRPPRILVTGFSVFPGAPVNPTEHLVAALRADPALLASHGEVRAEVLPVEYGRVPGLLEALGRDFAPDIAIHFGLSSKATGFTLERLARNAIAAAKPDNCGVLPPPACIFDGGADLPSTLPLDEIAARLAGAGLPVDWSDDAGGYLCNYLFYLSRSPAFAGLSAPMAGFVHVPPLREAEPESPAAMPLADLVRGARLVVAACAASWGAARMRR